MSVLILVPTSRELEVLQRSLGLESECDSCSLQLCGFGPIAAAARAGNLISRYKPERVMLIGIAGSFDTQRCPVGSAQRFDRAACFGIGVGSGSDHISASRLGWKQFGGSGTQPEIGDVIPLDSSFVEGIPATGTLLTCCSASATPQEADDRRARFPEATAEDMEGFAVATACTLAGVPLQIVRGISNEVGDRDFENWQIDEALLAAAALALRLVPRKWLPSQS